jgi:hypothetical protein
MKIAKQTIVLKKGHVLYKGFDGNVNNKVLANEKHFYLAPNHNTASGYANNGFVRAYELTRDTRLLHMTPRVVRYLVRFFLLKEVNGNRNRRLHANNPIGNMLRFAFKKINQQCKENIYDCFPAKLRGNSKTFLNNYTGRRASMHNVNKKVSEYICNFLKIHRLDGYYYNESRNGNGAFHTEIMLCDASKRLLKIKNTSTHAVFLRNYSRNPNTKIQKMKTLIKNLKIRNNYHLKNLAARKIQRVFRRRRVI